MSDDNVKLLTIYTEAALESSLIDDIEEHGAVGYTITNARGSGSSGARTAAWDANSITFTSDIEVLRPEKFSS